MSPVATKPLLQQPQPSPNLAKPRVTRSPKPARANANNSTPTLGASLVAPAETRAVGSSNISSNPTPPSKRRKAGRKRGGRRRGRRSSSAALDQASHVLEGVVSSNDSQTDTESLAIPTHSFDWNETTATASASANAEDPTSPKSEDCPTTPVSARSTPFASTKWSWYPAPPGSGHNRDLEENIKSSTTVAANRLEDEAALWDQQDAAMPASFAVESFVDTLPSLPALLQARSSEPRGHRPAYTGTDLPIPTHELPDTLPISFSAPQYTEAELGLPVPYTTEYPHPLSVYAGPGVNPATVAASGYAPLLAALEATNPKLMMGTILAECGRKDVNAPALTLEPGNKEGCGIPEKLWVGLSTWAAVKVPIGTVMPSVHAMRGTPPRFMLANTSKDPKGLPSPAPSDPASGTTPPSPIELTPDSPLSLAPSPHRFEISKLSHSRSDMDLRYHRLVPQRGVDQNVMSANFDAKRRGSLPNIPHFPSSATAGAVSQWTLHNDHHALSDVVPQARPSLSTFDPKDTFDRRPPHPPPHTPAPANPLSRRSSLPFNVLPPVAEVEDELEGTGASQRWKCVEPIGAERPRASSQGSTKVEPFILAGPGPTDFGGLSSSRRGSVSASLRPSSAASSVNSYSTHSVKQEEALAVRGTFATGPDNSRRGSISGSLSATSSLGHSSTPITQPPQYEEPTGYEHLSDDKLYELVRTNLSRYTALSTNQNQMDTPVVPTQHRPPLAPPLSTSGRSGTTASSLPNSVQAAMSNPFPRNIEPRTIEQPRAMEHQPTIVPARATEPARNYHHHSVPTFTRPPQVASTQPCSRAVAQPNVPAAAAVNPTAPARVQPQTHAYAHAHPQAHTLAHTHTPAQSRSQVHTPRLGFLPADINWGASATTTFDFSAGKSIWS